MSGRPPPPSPPPFVEGVHFYFENGRMVLTAKYLTDRGYCCGNGCRHCPYRGDDRVERAGRCDDPKS